MIRLTKADIREMKKAKWFERFFWGKDNKY